MADGKGDNPEGPLSSEALKRDEWRGQEEAPAPDAPGHTLPASEAPIGDSDEDGSERPNPIAGTMLPPD